VTQVVRMGFELSKNSPSTLVWPKVHVTLEILKGRLPRATPNLTATKFLAVTMWRLLSWKEKVNG